MGFEIGIGANFPFLNEKHTLYGLGVLFKVKRKISKDVLYFEYAELVAINNLIVWGNREIVQFVGGSFGLSYLFYKNREYRGSIGTGVGICRADILGETLDFWSLIGSSFLWGQELIFCLSFFKPLHKQLNMGVNIVINLFQCPLKSDWVTGIAYKETNLRGVNLAIIFTIVIDKLKLA